MSRLLLGFALASAAALLRPACWVNPGSSDAFEEGSCRVLNVFGGEYGASLWFGRRKDRF